MLRMARFLARYLLCLLLLNLAACSTMRTVDLQRAVQTSNARGVEYGRLVKVEMLDGRSARFRVTEMGDQGIGNGEAFYRYAEMESLKVEDPNSNARESTATWILGILGVIALVALVANSDSVRVCSPSPCPDG
jgi:hypothetical protein